MYKIQFPRSSIARLFTNKVEPEGLVFAAADIGIFTFAFKQHCGNSAWRRDRMNTSITHCDHLDDTNTVGNVEGVGVSAQTDVGLLLTIGAKS
jgi:hypothetical protein